MTAGPVNHSTPTDPGGVVSHAVTAADGRELAARTFPGESSDIVVIAGGAGIPQRFYAGIAEWIRARGPSVVTFDYRGMADSRHHHPRRDDARMRDWGRLDVEAVLRHARDRATGRLLWLGHSAGGWLLPLAASRHLPERIVTIGTLSPYWRLLTPMERWRFGVALHLVFPSLLGVVGHVPGRVWGGDDLPRGVARDWMRWSRHPEYFFGDPTLDTSGFAELTAPVLAVRATDDPWATSASHGAAHAWFSGSRVDVLDVTPTEVGAPRIGHFDLLRERVGGPVWPRLIDWLLAA